jgi:multidrug efflux system membrane fusion protein
MAARRLPVWIVGALALAALVYAVGFVDSYPRTDDAFVQADTIGVAAQVSGRIVVLKVRDNALVRQGDVLFEIDALPFALDAERLRAQLATLEQQIRLAQRQVDAQRYASAASESGIARAAATAAQRQSTLTRLEPLLAEQYVTAEQVEQARTARDTALAELAAARIDRRRAASAVGGVEALAAQRQELAAAIAHADYLREQTVVRAPFDGRVIDLHSAVGEFAAAGKPVFTMIDTGSWHVVANFRETELAKMHPGGAARIYLMSDPRRQLAGVVDSVGWGVLPDEGGSAQGLPKVPRAINWVHVAQRFPVRIRIAAPGDAPLRIGASAVAVIAPAGARP